MSHAPAVAARSLAGIEPGQTVRIAGFLFGLVESCFTGRGVAMGDAVRCRRASSAVLVLETVDQRTVVVETDWARFVTVESERATAAA